MNQPTKEHQGFHEYKDGKRFNPDCAACQPMEVRMEGRHSYKKPIKELSPMQVRVIDMMAQGLSDREIGAELNRSIQTVKSHGGILREKLEARNRAHAVAIGIRRGLI